MKEGRTVREHRRAVFIVLEGGDGAGKTTQSRALCSGLRREGYRIHSTAEPSRSAVGRLVRQNFLQREKIAPEVEALLFAADRFLHLKSEVRPALSARKIVVCDRYMYASLAYQGAQGVDMRWLREINRFAEKPDLAIYLDVPAEMALGRIARKKSVLEQLDFQQRVRQEYLKLVQAGELVLVDSTQPIKKVANDIFAIVRPRLLQLEL